MKTVAMRLIPILACTLLAACVTNIKSEHAPGVKFINYKTFRWKEPQTKNQRVENPILDSDIFKQRVKNAVINTLLGRGYTRAPKGTPADFNVTYHIASRQTVESNGGFSANIGYGYGFGYPFGFGGLFGVPYGNNDVQSQQEGILMVDVVNPKTQRLVWRGWKTEQVTQENFSSRQVDQSVRKILKRFPPK